MSISVSINLFDLTRYSHHS